MFGVEWVGPLLAVIGLIVVLATFELLSVLITGIGDQGETTDLRAGRKRAA